MRVNEQRVSARRCLSHMVFDTVYLSARGNLYKISHACRQTNNKTHPTGYDIAVCSIGTLRGIDLLVLY